jgi:flagellar FliL protein
MAVQDDTESGVKSGDEKPKSKKKLIIIIVAVIVVFGLGAVGLLFMGGGETEVVDEYDLNPEKFYTTAPLGTLIVNLSASASFLKTNILLEYDSRILERANQVMGHSGAAGSGLSGILGLREPMIRDATIKTLSAKSAREVLTTEGKITLKDELIEAINEAIGYDDYIVTNVYFTEFIVQAP